MELDTNNHSVFLLYYHLVLVTKYRRQVIDDEISDYAKTTFERISESYHITLVEWNHDKDHVHIMFKAQPKTELTKFINAYKSASSRLIKRDFPRVKQFLWNTIISLDKSKNLRTTGIAWLIRDIAVNKDISLQVCSIPKNLPLQALRIVKFS
ncbi:IS200/IS605 family transposase [Enterococcus faecium]